MSSPIWGRTLLDAVSAHSVTSYGTKQKNFTGELKHEAVPQARDIWSDVLQLESKVWRQNSARGAEVEGAGVGGQHAQEAADRVLAGRCRLSAEPKIVCLQGGRNLTVAVGLRQHTHGRWVLNKRMKAMAAALKGVTARECQSLKKTLEKIIANLIGQRSVGC
ncbi:hypothetical protein AFAE65S_00197 [Alcaligenes phenolicus]